MLKIGERLQNGGSPLSLQSLHDIMDLLVSLQADVEEAHELRARYPAEITQALIPSADEGSQNYGPEADAMCSQGCRVVEPDVHPRVPINPSGSSTFAEAHFLSGQKTNLVRLLSHIQKRLF